MRGQTRVRMKLIIWALAAAPLWAQGAGTGQGKPSISPSGIPFITWYGPDVYGGAPQVWSIAEDTRGVLYFGHQGILEYDGTSFRKIRTPHNSSVRSLALGPQGRVYVAEAGDFGFLQPDAKGDMQYQSMLSWVPKEERDFQDVSEIVMLGESVYFRTRERLLRMTPEGSGWRCKSWKSPVAFGRAYNLFGTLHIIETAGGLLRLENDRLVPVQLPGLTMAKVEDRPVALLPWDAATRQILVLTSSGRFFVLNGTALRPFPHEAGLLLGRNNISIAATLPDGAIGIGVRRGGLLILERDGRARHLLGRTAGIASDGVISIYCDRLGNVWLGLQNGIAKLETSSPLSEFAAAHDMSAAVNDIKRHGENLYVATMIGLRRLGREGRFEVVPGSETHSVFSLLPRPRGLVSASSIAGVFEVSGGRYRQAREGQPGVSFMALGASFEDPKRVWIGTVSGLESMREAGPGGWIEEGVIARTPQIRSIVESEPGVLWLGTQSRGVVRVRLKPGSLKDPQVDRFGKAHGLPSEGGASVHRAGKHLLFASIEGVREFDPATQRFVESKSFGMVPTGGSPEEYTVVSDKDGNLWINFGVLPVFFAKQADGSYQPDLNRLRRLPAGRVSWLFLDDDKVLWLGGQDRVFRFDPSKERRSAEPFPALIRRVVAGDTDKSVLYSGGGGRALQQRTEIPYRANAVRLEFAAASLEDPARNQFKSMLEGFDTNWSAWTTETRRDYTNLPPGKYTFRVKALNSRLIESTEDGVYHFEILPPWYRTWWAYGGYMLLLAGAAFGSDRLMRHRLIAKERAASAARMIEAELERKRNVELLSEIGKEITASLDIDTIFHKLYENVNQLMDATVFGVGLYHSDAQAIEYRLAFESGKKYEPYRRDTGDKDQFPVWCIDHRKPVFVNDVDTEYSKYLSRYEARVRKLEDGTASRPPQSLIYLPLIAKDRVLGIITVQSFQKNAYTEYQLNLLENLAAYTSIALDNADAYQNLKSAQEKLLVQEKLASLGALTAGIAHEIKNPLNFVNNFADLSVELTVELREEMEKQKSVIAPEDFENLEELLKSLSGNARKINEHGRRADGIVRSMLLHSRGQAGERQATDLNAMLEEYVNLAYHGMRAQDSSFNITIQRELAPDIGKIDAVPQDLSRVFLNILNNACYAANDKAKKAAPGFTPILAVRTVNLGDWVEVRIRDNGLGIPQEIRDRIFHPFFTTKPTGQGTGLGLSISHDIVVVEHGGQLEVETEAGEFTELIVRLPRQGRKAA